jgi:O-antigen ligase
MIYTEQKNSFVIIIPLAVMATFAIAYLVIGKEMAMLLQGIIAAFLLLVCFLSVRLSLVLLIFSMLLSPEIGAGATSSRAVTVRGEDLFLLCMTLGWIFRMAIFKDIGFMRKNRLTRPIMIYAAAAIVATALGSIRGDVNMLSGFFFVLKLLEYFVLFFLVVNYLSDEKEINSLLTMMIIVWVIVAVYGIAMVATGQNVAAPFEGKAAERNTLSGYLVLVGSVVGGVILRDEQGGDKKWLVIALLIAAVVLLFSISRSGWVAAIVSFVVLFITARNKNAFVLIICLGILIIPFIIPEAVSKRLEFTFSQHSMWDKQVEIFGIRLDTSSSARWFSAMFVLNKIGQQPFFGYGITGFSQFLDGQFFRVLAEMGIVGLCTFIYLLFCVHNILFKAMREITAPRLAGMATGMYAGFWAMVVHATTANTFIIIRICEPFWFLVGLTILAYDFQKDREAALVVDEPVKPKGLIRLYERIR